MSLYQELADEIHQSILEGVYSSGERLPSIRDMSSSRQLSVNTVQKAYSQLEQRGVISARPKTGYFVRLHSGKTPTSSNSGRPWRGDFVDLMPTLLSYTGRTDLLNLGLAQPESDVIPDELIAKTMRSILRSEGSDLFAYCESAGLPELRNEIVKLMSGYGLTVGSGNIVVTNGGQEAITIALQAVTSAGDIVAVESPCYCGALQTLSNLGLEILEIPSSQDHGIRQDVLADASTRHRIAACYVMTSVSNPKGGSMTEADKRSLCELADYAGFSIVEDAVNLELGDSEEIRRPIKAYDDSDNVLLCSSFSKSVSPGLRTGWIIAGSHQADALKLKYGASLNVSPLNQLTAARLISAGHYRRHITKLRKIHSQTRRLLQESVERYFPADTEVSDPAGGHCLWLQLPERFDTTQISIKTVESGVAFAPGKIFSARGDLQNCLRIGWGGSWNQNVDCGIQKIAATISNFH